MSRSKTLLLMAALSAPLWLDVPTAHGDAASCQVPFTAMNKLLQTPSHQYMTETAGYLRGKTRSSEIITTADVRYLLISGKWHHSPINKQQLAEQIASGLQNIAKDECRYLRDEKVGGETAALYTAHHKTEDDTSDTQLWISKNSGLPLRMEIDMDVGGGANGKSHSSIRVEYSNIAAPAGVQ